MWLVLCDSWKPCGRKSAREILKGRDQERLGGKRPHRYLCQNQLVKESCFVSAWIPQNPSAVWKQAVHVPCLVDLGCGRTKGQSDLGSKIPLPPPNRKPPCQQIIDTISSWPGTDLVTVMHGLFTTVGCRRLSGMILIRTRTVRLGQAVALMRTFAGSKSLSSRPSSPNQHTVVL
jgi:hypothetical protein